MQLFDKILAARGIDDKTRAAFLLPDYLLSHNPFLLPDMDRAVVRLQNALAKQEKITIYGDYDIDGLSATALMIDAFNSFGFKNIDYYMPNRFVDGYGLNIDAVESIASRGTNLIVTVDCGSLSEASIVRANELEMEVIVTDHHNAADVQPPAIAVVNPKRSDNKYPFIDLAGVGVAFKLVQAMQSKIPGLNPGQEKWLLDLVALGTVCDVVPLQDENRTNVYYGLKVLSQARRPGLKALMAVAGIDPKSLNARSLGFGIGPRMNASGRLETAQHALDMLLSVEPLHALELAQYLDSLNTIRKSDQAKIMKAAIIQAEQCPNDSVLVLSGKDWSHGIVGIVASKILERYKKPAFIIQEMGVESKGSARSYGDFSAADAVKYCKDIIISGGGHDLAAGVTLSTSNIDAFRKKINEYYLSKKITNQEVLLLPKLDVEAKLVEVTEELVLQISQLEPFGNGNPQPILKTNCLTVKSIKKMGSDSQHIKLDLIDDDGVCMQFLAFNAPDYFDLEIGKKINVWYHPSINEWQGRRTVEGQLLHVEIT